MKTDENRMLNELFQQLARIAGYLWEKGWSEKNAGNISVLLPEGFEAAGKGEEVEMNPEEDLPGLKGRSLFITGTGKRMRDMAESPRNSGVILHIGESGRTCTYRSTGDQEATPSSEWPTHLAIHNMIAGRGTGEKVVLHTHATELIAMTQHTEIDSADKLNKILWGMHPETMVFVPKGVGLLRYMLPGTAEIARATLECFTEHDMVVWEKHGIFAIGETLDETFDSIDIVCKSAKIWFLCRSAGFEPEGLSADELEELRQLVKKFNK